ncbi:hypothetical protein [Caballeronia sp. AZ1_KS37]|uniref:hypothetical protein n=1 Tax=Caballeronia sp. AZ1_KS37 TaxID=2921756 RepID=UPI00202895F8|nr:hypothetical protein [Caballeronia sp. AZ1_KS37]
MSFMSYEPPVLSDFIAAGDEINLALLEIDSREFATAEDRNLAQRAVFTDVMEKRGLPDRRQAVLCHEISALVANRPIMTSLFDFVELKALCMLRVAPSLVDRFIAVKRDNPEFGLGEIMAVAVEAREHHQWGHYWQE